MGAGPLVGYYTGRDGELAGRWAAGGSMSVTVGAAVTPQQLTASLSAVDPGSGERLGRRYTPGGTYVDNLGVTRRRRKFSAYDVVYAPPKSISVAWALADPTTRKEVEAAWDRSVGAVVGFVQAEAVASRSGTNGVRREEVPAGATIARFDHWTSRAADPHVHAHLLVHNRVQCSDGKWRTLDGRLLYHNAAAASAVGGAVLRAELSRRLGWSWDRVGDHWHAELAGSPRRLIAEWSTRRRQIDRAAQAKIRRFETAQQREPTPAERAELWARAQRTTRPSKQDDPDPPHPLAQRSRSPRHRPRPPDRLVPDGPAAGTRRLRPGRAGAIPWRPDGSHRGGRRGCRTVGAARAGVPGSGPA